jgi:hypothetical protein
MYYLEHAESEEGAIGLARRFPFATLEEAVEQGKHDMQRTGTKNLVVGIRDENEKLVVSAKELKE